MILCANPKAQYLAYKDAIDAAVARVLESGWYVLGREVAAFEAEFGAWLSPSDSGVPGGQICQMRALGVGNGTDALHVALAGIGVGPGDEVVTPAHTATATAAAILQAGARPVFADVDETTATLDPADVERALSPRTKAVIAVHLYGRMAEVDRLGELARRSGARLVEDCAQAHGAMAGGRMAGTIGDVAAFSFYPTKNLGAIGDGGAVVTADEAIYERCRLLREYGWRERYVSDLPGWNTRLDEIQAAILRVKLAGLHADNARRARLAAIYEEELAGLPVVTPPGPAWIPADGQRHVFHLYVIRLEQDGLRDELAAWLKDNGVGTGVHYPVPIHRQPAYAEFARPLPVTERLAGRILSLPMYPELPEADARQIGGLVRKFYKTRK